MSTQTLSYAAIVPRIPRCQQLILDALTLQLPASREELALRTGLRLSCVCGRVSPMLAEGRLVVTGTVWNKETKRHVELISLP